MDGRNIAVIRKKRKITQEELAQALSINTVTLSRWENGHFEPKASMIKKLCEMLSCTESEGLSSKLCMTFFLCYSRKSIRVLHIEVI